MLKINRNKAVTLFFLALLVTSLSFIQPCFAQNQARIDPVIIDTTVSQQFSATVLVDVVYRIKWFEFWLNFDPTQMMVMNVAVIPPWTETGKTIGSNYVLVRGASFPIGPGSIPLAEITFRCMAPGSSMLTFNYVQVQREDGMMFSLPWQGSVVNQHEFYWKPARTDYALSGLPDFDQRQDNWKNPQTGKWSYCGPTALADSFWWLDSFYEPGSIVPPNISDGFNLVKSYNTSWDDHDPRNVPPLIEDLAWYVDTDGIRTEVAHNGTYVNDLEAAINWWLVKNCLDNKLYVRKVFEPSFEFVEYEVEKCEDVILLLGFYHFNTTAPPAESCWRIGGHYVTVAGVESATKKIAFSDPTVDYAEPPPHGVNWAGQILPAPPHPHPVNPPDTVHNNATYVSHDQYGYVDTTMYPCVDGIWGPAGYENWTIIQDFIGQNGGMEGDPAFGAPGVILVTTVEYAVVVSPTTWHWKGHYPDYALSGLPDFYQYQYSWTKYCGPTAVADSLWWFDSKFEPRNVSPPTISDGFRLVQSYDPSWDDHDLANVQPFIEDLALYMDTNGIRTGTVHNGTEVHDMEEGIAAYLKDKNLTNTFYERTWYNPQFPEVEKEVERCEDVVLLITFFQITPDYECWPIGGHFVTVAGVDSQNLMIAFSDPGIDNAEPSPHGNNGTGRVIPPPPHNHLPDGTLHNNATFVSHDIYNVTLNVPVPGVPGIWWGPTNYASNLTFVLQYLGQNIPEELQHLYNSTLVPGSKYVPVVTHAVIVSPRPGIVAAGSTNKQLRAYDFDGKSLWNFTAGGEIASIAMSVDGEYIAVGSVGNALFLFLRNGTQLWNKTIPISDAAYGVGRESKSVGISADGNYIVASTANGLILYSKDGTKIWNYTGLTKCVSMSANGNFIACITTGGYLRMFSSLYDGVSGWQASDGTPLWTKPAVNTPSWLALDALGQYLAACNSTDVFLMDTTGRTIWNHALNRGGITRCDITWDGRSVVVVNDDGSDQVGAELCYFNDTKDGTRGWNSTDGTPIWKFAPSPDAKTNDLYTVDISKYGDVIATGGAPTNIYLLTKNGAVLQNITDPNTIMTVDLTFTGQYGTIGDGFIAPGKVYFICKENSTSLWNCTIGGSVRAVAVSEIYPSMLPIANHDLAVTAVEPDKASVTPGTVVKVNVNVTNEGWYAESFFDVFVEAFIQPSGGGSGKKIEVKQNVTGPLDPDDYVTVTVDLDTTGFADGNYTITGKVSLVQYEVDIFDNTHVDGTLEVETPAGIHDVAVTDIKLQKNAVGLGYNCTINVTVANQGDFYETFNVTLYGNLSAIGSKEIINMENGTSTVLIFVWDTPGWEKGNYTIKAVADTVDGETETGDNELIDSWIFVSTPGDVDADKDVDIYDIVSICGAYGSKRGQPHYVANCDIINDGNINIFDVVAACSNYKQPF